MGVFALFRRKSKSEVATAAGADAGTEGTVIVTDGAPEAAAGTAEKAPEVSETREDAETGEVAEVAEPIEIPKQQSAEEAADNEPAGDGAHQ